MTQRHSTQPGKTALPDRVPGRESRFIQNVLEMALSLVDFQENIINSYGPENILEEAEKRIRYLIPFESNALYLVNQDNSDFQLAVCNPPEVREAIAAEVEDMIEKGFFAWPSASGAASRLPPGIAASGWCCMSSPRTLVSEAFSSARWTIPASKSRTRPDAAVDQFCSTPATRLESLEFCQLLRHQKITLEKQVEERTQALAESERQMQQVLKLQAIGTLAGGIATISTTFSSPSSAIRKSPWTTFQRTARRAANLEEVLKAANSRQGTRPADSDVPAVRTA